MSLILTATLPIFALILLGFVCARTNLLGAGVTDALNRFVVYLALPAVLFRGMATTTVHDLLNINFLAVFGLGMLLTFALAFLLTRRTHPSRTDASLEGLAASYPNTAFIGIPLCQMILGPESLPATVLATFLVVCVLMAVSIVLIEIDRQESPNLPTTLRKIGLSLLKNPLLLAPVLGIAYATTRLPLPAPVSTSLTLLGNAATPCALVTIGLFLAEKQPAGNPGAVARLVFLKLLFQPALTALLTLTVFKMPPLWTQAALLLSALPTGTGPFMLAKLYTRDAAVPSRTVLVSTLLSLLTLSLLLLFFSR